jgi:hypothetical protein
MTRRRVLLISLLAASLTISAGCGRKEVAAGRSRDQRSPSPCGGDGFGSPSVLRELQPLRVETYGVRPVAGASPLPFLRINHELKTFTQDYLEKKGVKLDRDTETSFEGRPEVTVGILPRDAGRVGPSYECLQLRVSRSVTINDLNCSCMLPVWERMSCWDPTKVDESSAAIAKEWLEVWLKELCRDAGLNA